MNTIVKSLTALAMLALVQGVDAQVVPHRYMQSVGSATPSCVVGQYDDHTAQRLCDPCELLAQGDSAFQNACTRRARLRVLPNALTVFGYTGDERVSVHEYGVTLAGPAVLELSRESLAPDAGEAVGYVRILVGGREARIRVYLPH